MPGPKELKELHYICPIENVPSIMKHGILCHKRAKALKHLSLADEVIQRLREKRPVPGGMPLHNYANLYFNARNAMLYRLLKESWDLCVLGVSPDVLNLPDVVISDGNAASDAYTRFGRYPDMLSRIDWGAVFSRNWVDPCPPVMHHKRRVMCAEVLVPQRLHPRFIVIAYVSCEESKLRLEEIGLGISIEVNNDLFFR